MTAAGGTGARALTRRRRLGALVPVALVVVVLAAFALRISARERSLRRHGVVTAAVVLQIDTSRDTDYLLVGLLDCGCRVWVATDRPSAHPLGSQLLVRHDAGARHAEALVDRPNPYASLLAPVAGIVGGIALIGVLAGVAWRRRRRAIRLLDQPAMMRVRIEAWERQRGNTTVPYLSVYPVDAPAGASPLSTFPIDRRVLEHLTAGITLEVHGDPEPGAPVAFRAGDLRVLPAGKTRDAAWEAKHRQPLATIDLADDERPVALLASSALLLEPADARSWLRLTTILRWVFAASLMAPLIRFMREHLLPYALVAIGIDLVAVYGSLWAQRRLLDRIASRLPGPMPDGRRARRAARAAVVSQLRGDGGRRLLAAQLHTTPERLAARDRRGAIAPFAVAGLAVLVVVGGFVHAIASI